MVKTILITGSTDGIGLETAKMLAADGHLVLMHGRNASKLEVALKEAGAAEGFVAHDRCASACPGGDGGPSEA